MKAAAKFLIGALTVLALAACGDKVQTAGGRKADAKPWDAAQDGFVVPGWKSGDQASWEDQMRNRAQSQNEYARAAAQSK